MAIYTISQETPIQDTTLHRYYDCHITDTGERRMMDKPFNRYSYFGEHHPYEVERIIDIKIGERDFRKLLHDFKNIQSIIDNLNDPIINDMYQKLLIYIKLKT